MVGCADGLVSGPDKEDLGLRATDNMVFCTGGANERVRITGIGSVGVNINNPFAQFQVNSTKNAETDRFHAENYHLALRNPADDNGESIGLSFGITSNATKVGAAILHERDGGGSQGSLQFYTSSDGNSLSERLRIDSSGRLLLGTTTEGVSTGDKFTIATSSNTGMTLRSGTSNEGNIFFSDGTSGADEYRGSIQYNHGSNFLTIGTDGVERLRINQHGTITNTTNSSHSQGAGTFNIKGIINQYSQGSGSGLIFDCDFGRLTGYADNASIANSANLSSALAHSTTDWTSSSSNTPMTVNGGSFNYRVGFGGYLDCVQNEGRVSIGAGSGVPAMSDKLNTASMTIETWIWYDGAGREVIVSRYGSGFPNQFNMLCDPNGQFHYNNTGVGAGGGNITGQHFPDKTWHHHLWQYDSGNNVNRWYINGAFANSASAGSSLAVGSSTGFAIASRADDMERWDGKIAIVRIYNRALSATEIKNHFELERGRFGV